jgi:hypothetical protein
MSNSIVCKNTVKYLLQYAIRMKFTHLDADIGKKSCLYARSILILTRKL